MDSFPRMAIAAAVLMAVGDAATQEAVLSDWTRHDLGVPVSGRIAWSASQGSVVLEGSAVAEAAVRFRSFFVAGSPGESDYTLRVTVRRDARYEDERLICAPYGLVLRFRDPENYYAAVFLPEGRVALDRVRGGVLERLAETPGYAPLYIDNFIDFTARKDILTLRLNGRPLLQARDHGLVAGRAGFFADAGLHAHFVEPRLYRHGELPFQAVPLLLVKPPYIVWAADDKAVVMWETNRPATAQVLYREKDGNGHEVTLDSTGDCVKRAMLTGLARGTEYVYRVRIEGSNRGGGGFRTDPGPAGALSVAFLGNTAGDPGRFENFNGLIARRVPDFIMNLGGAVDHAAWVDSWDAFYFRPGRTILGRLPTYVAVGYRDQYPNRYWFNHYLPYPGTGLEVRDGARSAYYAFTYGCAAFAVVDNYFDFAPGSLQYRWLETKLSSPAFQEAAWRIVACHEPPFSVERGRWSPGNVSVREHLLPLCARLGVDVLVAGHEHTYKRGRTDDVVLIVNGGGGPGPSNYRFTGAYHFAARLLGYTSLQYSVMRADARRLVWTCYGLDDRVLDEFTLENAQLPAPASAAASRQEAS